MPLLRPSYDACEVNVMLMRSCPSGLRAGAEVDDRRLAWTDPLASALRLPVSYTAFCRDHWQVYCRFGAATAGSARTGSSIACAALRDLGEQWDTALRSPSLSAHAWDLLSSRAAERRTESLCGLHRLLDRDAADALVLRYKLGLSAREAGHAMGLPEADFELLRSRALRCAIPTRTP
jgi:hypothetical protein